MEVREWITPDMVHLIQKVEMIRENGYWYVGLIVEVGEPTDPREVSVGWFSKDGHEVMKFYSLDTAVDILRGYGLTGFEVQF